MRVFISADIEGGCRQELDLLTKVANTSVLW